MELHNVLRTWVAFLLSCFLGHRGRFLREDQGSPQRTSGHTSPGAAVMTAQPQPLSQDKRAEVEGEFAQALDAVQ
jgi:hypothetical protein